MKCMLFAALCLLAATLLPVQAAADSHGQGSEGKKLLMIIKLLGDLQESLAKEGHQAEKLFDEEKKMCSKRSRELRNEYEEAKRVVENLKAKIGQQDLEIKRLDELMFDLKEIITQDTQTKLDTEQMKRDDANLWVKESRELQDTVNKLERAVEVVSMESRKQYKSKSLLQMEENADIYTDMLKTMLAAQSIRLATDDAKLTALIQTVEGDGSDSEDDAQEEHFGQQPAAYSSKSGRLIELINSVLERAQEELREAQIKQVKDQANFDKTIADLKQKLKYNNRDFKKAEKKRAETATAMAQNKGDLVVAEKTLSGKDLEDLQKVCLEKANDYEQATTSRHEEVQALEQAKKSLQDATGTGPSFLQVANRQGSTENAAAAARSIRRAGVSMNDPILLELASRLDYASQARDDPMGRVRAMIEKMINKLVEEGIADAEHQAWCKSEMGVTEVKINDTQEEVDRLTTSIEKAKAKVAVLAEEIKKLDEEIAEIRESQLELDKVFREETKQFKANKKDCKEAIEALRKALLILRQFYSKSGKPSTVIPMIESVESEYTESLNEFETQYQEAQSEYNKVSKENAVQLATKQAAVDYKTKETTELTKQIRQEEDDLWNAKEELDALKDYMAKLREQCIVPPETFEMRSAARKKEIAGLKEGLNYLNEATNGEASALQVSNGFSGATNSHTIAFLQLRGARHQVALAPYI